MTEPGVSSSTEEGLGWIRKGGRVDAPLLVPALPSEVPFGCVNRLVPARSGCEFRMIIDPIRPEEALRLIDAAGSSAGAEIIHPGNEPSRSSQLERELESARELGRQLVARETELWHTGLSFHSFGPSSAKAVALRDALGQRLRSMGFKPRIPGFHAGRLARPPEPGSEGTPPSGLYHTLPTEGVAAFFPFVDEGVQEPGGILVGLLLDDATPIFLNRWAESSHSWAVFGMTGAGKSFSAALWLLRTRWMTPGVDIVAVDPLGDICPMLKNLGGLVLAPGATPESRWNPLALGPGLDQQQRVARIGTLMRTLFPSLRDEEAALLDSAVARVVASARIEPTLGDLLDALPGSGAAVKRLRGLLDVFVSGSLSSFNGRTTFNTDGNPLGIDLSGVPEEHLPFVLTLTLSALEERLRHSRGPKLLIIDEAHRLVRHASAGEFLDQLVRRARHYSTGVLLLSQNPEDFLGSESGRSVLRNVQATLLLRLPSVSNETRMFFDLSPGEVEWLPRARLPREAGYAEGLLRFGPAHMPLAIVASTGEYELLSGERDGPRDAPVGVRDAGRTVRL